MHHQRPIPSELRLQRYQRWMLLWLRWFTAFLDAVEAFAPLSAEARAIAHCWLDRVERALISLVLLRVVPRIRARNSPRHSAYRRKEAALWRALVGSRLRQTLRAKDLRQRIAVLSQNIEPLVARLLRRIPRGLTRRRPIPVCRKARMCDMPRVVENAALCADTS